MKIIHKVQAKKMIEYQKSMAQNVLPKSERLYQRLLEKEKQELEKDRKMRAGKFHLGKFGQQRYGIYKDMAAELDIRDIDECDSECSSISGTGTNFMTQPPQKRTGSSRK